MNAARGDRLDEVHLEVLPLGELELGLHHEVERVDGERAEDQDRERQGDAADRDHRSDGLALDVAQDDPRGLREQPLHPQPLGKADSVLGWRFGAHGLGRLEPHRSPHRGIRPEDRGGDADQDGAGHDVRLQPVGQRGKPEEVVVHLQHPAAQQSSADGPDERSAEAYCQSPVGVVQGDVAPCVSKGFERRDLLPLHGDDSLEDNVQEEHRHGEEDDRNADASPLQTLQLVLDRPVGELQVPGDRPPAPVGLQQFVQLLNHRFRTRPGHEQERHVVEAPLHVEGRREGPSLHPEDSEARVVRDHLAGPDGVDVFGREADSDHFQIPAAAVEDRPDRVPGPQAVGLREVLADDHLARPARIDVAPAAQRNVVEDLTPLPGDRDQPPGGGLLHAFHVKRHVHHDAQLGLRHARDSGDSVSEGQGRPLEGGEDVSEPLPLVVGVASEVQGVEGAQVHDEHEHAHSDDHADGERLALDAPEVAEQLAVQGGHGSPAQGACRNLRLVASLGRDAAIRQVDHAVSDVRDGAVVSDYRSRGTEFAIDAFDGLEDNDAGRNVQCARGLVAEQDVGALCDRARDRHALLLAAGHLGGKVIHAIPQADDSERLAGGHRISGDLGNQRDVLLGGQAGDEVVELEHEPHMPAAVAGARGIVRPAEVAPAVRHPPASGKVQAS